MTVSYPICFQFAYLEELANRNLEHSDISIVGDDIAQNISIFQ